MKEFKTLQKKVKTIKKQIHELNTFDTSIFLGKTVKISKKYVDWMLKNGENCGIPYSEIDLIRNRPKGTINSIRFDGIVDGYVFFVKIEGMDPESRIGVEDFDIISSKTDKKNEQ